ncbi:ATPase [Xanthobacter dioxanivorans]|uniref:ATPase n=1 Tax=Xanthobacter dioxanivorans TaxID=2528964 RepID=A0A974SGT9_9HYPH|nr:ATP12 family protein [Xanthobacter dioxanivorans]QRG05020.1 ATPase [Xanthobacter dioxanivorans]
MRDLLEGIEDSVPGDDPVARARAAQRTPLPKRFYTDVSVGEGEGGFTILLDGRPVRTPARRLLAAPTRALAEAMAAEWAAQASEINPFFMPLTRLVNVALDRVAPEADAVRDEVVLYAGSDMLFYRAEGPQKLVERQAAHWDRVLDWMNEAHDARFFLAEGVRHVAQPEAALAQVRALVPLAPLALGAVHSMTTLTGSALLALAVAEDRLTVDEAWVAAHVDEDWNREQWGEDEAASARRAARRTEMDAAARLIRLLA